MRIQSDMFKEGKIFESDNIVIPSSFDEAGGLAEMANKMIAYAFLVAGALSIVFIFWGGIKLIIAGGEEEKLKTALGTIRHAILGLVITIFSFTAVALIGKLVGLDIVGFISREQIWEMIADLWQ